MKTYEFETDTGSIITYSDNGISSWETYIIDLDRWVKVELTDGLKDSLSFKTLETKLIDWAIELNNEDDRDYDPAIEME